VSELAVKPLQIRVAKGVITLVPEDRHVAPLEAPLTIHPLQNQTIEMMVAMLRENRLRDEQEYQVLGANLWTVLLGNEIGKRLHDELQVPKQLIRVELEFTGEQGWMARWPWEYLYCPLNPSAAQSGYFLARRTSRLLLTRQVGLREGTRRLLVDRPPVKVLLVVASPDPSDETEALARVQYERLYEALQDFAKPLEGRLEGRIELISLIAPHRQSTEYVAGEPPRATYQNFLNVMQNRSPHVVHFVGHGKCVKDGGQLAFVGPDYKAQWIPGATIAEDLQDLEETRLVFLQACESALPDPYQAISGVAMQLAHRNIPAVVAMQYAVENAVASDFARAFYGALVESRPVDVAVQEARSNVAGHVGDWSFGRAFGLPVLYLRQSEALVPSEDRRGAGLGREVVAQPSFRIVNSGVRTVSVEPAIPQQNDRLEDVNAAPPSGRDVIECPKCHTAYVPSPQKRFCSTPACGMRLVCPFCRIRLPLGDEKVCGHCGKAEADWIEPGARYEVADHVG